MLPSISRNSYALPETDMLKGEIASFLDGGRSACLLVRERCQGSGPPPDRTHTLYLHIHALSAGFLYLTVWSRR